MAPKQAALPRCLLLVLTLALPACTRRPPPTPNAVAPAAILRISQRNEPEDLDPARAALPDDFFIIRALSEGLVVPNPAGGTPLPAAADRWSLSPDGLTCTFHLREGGLWSNGDPVTAADFIASFRRVLTPATAAPKAELLFVIKNARSFAAGRLTDFRQVGLSAPDPRTLVVNLERPTPEFLNYAASGPWIPVDPRVTSRLGRSWTRPGSYVGNGPFILQEWTPDQRIVVRKNPRYHAATGIRLDEIQFIRFDDGDTEERAYRSGEVDVTMAVPFAKLASYARDHPTEFHHAALAETRYLAFNTNRPPLTDPRVRRALSLAVDRHAIVAFVVKGGCEPAGQLIPPGLDDRQRAATAPAPESASLPLARRLLAAAGFPGGRGFPRLELSGWASPSVLEAVQAMWKKDLGVEVAVATSEARVHEAALRSGKYDIGFITLIPDVADPIPLLERFTTGNPENYPQWSDPGYDGLVADGKSSAAEARIAAQCPLAPLYYNATNWLMRPSVHGWSQDALWTRNYNGLWLDEGGASGRRAPGAGGILRLGNADEPQGLDPQIVSGDIEFRVVSALMTGLAEQDPRDEHPVPGLARSWDISSDGLTYTFHLRDGLKWSNGDPLTSQDFIASYKRLLTPAFAAPYAYLVYNYVRGAEDYYTGKETDFGKVGFQAPDDRTLVVHLKHATPYLLKIIAQHWSWDAVPVRVIARYGGLFERGNRWTRPGNYVGDGPFRLKEWRAQQKIVVERNPDYWDAAGVKSDEIEFYPIQDLAAEERMFRTGELDATYQLPQSKIEVYRREHPEEIHTDPFLSVYYYEFNVTRPPFTDVRVRRALAMAIDRERLVRDVTLGGEAPAYALSYPGTAGYWPRARLKPDLAEARRLLAAAGYPDGRGFPAVELLYNTQSNHLRIAETIQAMWRTNLGVEVTLQNQEWKVYEDAVHTHNYQVARAGWIADYIDPHAFLEIFETGGGNNFTAWSNPRYDQLLHAAMAAGTQAERYEDYQQMDAILVDQCPVMPIYYYTRSYALNPKVRGWWPTLLNEHPWKYVYVER